MSCRCATPRPPISALALVLASRRSPPRAQSTSATIRGTVVDDTGGLPGASHRGARDRQRLHLLRDHGRRRQLRRWPACGPARTTSRSRCRSTSRPRGALTVLVGQNIDLDFRLTADLVYTENVTVVGELAVDIKTSQIATNITAEQIETCPRTTATS